MIPYGKQMVTEKDINAVVDVLKSDYLTQGPVLPKFEAAVSKKCGADFGVATNSATSSLHIACLALGVVDKSLVWTSAISFVASSNCALYCGSQVDFVDIDPDTFNISAKTLRQKIQFNLKNKLPLPIVVIVVHMAGQSCDMAGIHILSKEYGFSIIEDASHGIGGEYKGNPVGCCEYSDITIFSFHPVKIITTGEGGIALTKSKALAEKMNLYRSHGVTRDISILKENEGPWYYEQVELGFNYRMTEIQAALGLSQLDSLDDFVSQRNSIAKKYSDKLQSKKIILPVTQGYAHSSWHLYIIQLNVNLVNREKIFIQLRGKGLGVNVHYRPIYLNPYYQKLGFKKGICPNAEAYYASCISLPLYHGMSKSEQDTVIEVVNEVCE